jgi:arsenite methyltransferase
MRDRWAEWLLDRRFAGDAAQREKYLTEVAGVRDRLLDNAGPLAGRTLLDVGCGDGLIGFGALERDATKVIFSDISEDLLGEAQRVAADLAVLDRSRFARARAEDLSAIETASVDVVTTRSVLIYVEDKERAFAELSRVLRPGGRVSLFEPINAYFPVDRNRLVSYDATPVRSLVDRIRAVYERIQPPGEDPMLDFDERDLIRLAERAGLEEIHVRLRVDVEPTEPRSWASFLNTPGNPRIPSLAEAMDEVLSAEERERVTAHVRPLVEEGRGVSRLASAYLWAVKPSG